MNIRLLIFAISSLILLFSSPALIFTEANHRTAYEILGSYNFPVGILPKGVIGYKFNENTGRFAVYWKGACEFAIENYHLKYESTIRGYISNGQLSSLEGISVKLVFFWTQITEVSRSEDELYFFIGRQAAATFPAEIFFVSPQCGCGMDCGDDSNLSLQN